VRALVQRVTSASVTIDSQVVGRIETGLVVLIGVSNEDAEDEAQYIVNKVINLRIFADEQGRFDTSAIDEHADLLIISQFTLYGDTRKGRRPSFTSAALPGPAEAIFDRTIALFKETGLKVETGRFQAYMSVEIHNDGPVTIMIDSVDRRRPRQGLRPSTNL